MALIDHSAAAFPNLSNKLGGYSISGNSGQNLENDPFLASLCKKFTLPLNYLSLKSVLVKNSHPLTWDSKHPHSYLHCKQPTFCLDVSFFKSLTPLVAVNLYNITLSEYQHCPAHYFPQTFPHPVCALRAYLIAVQQLPILSLT